MAPWRFSGLVVRALDANNRYADALLDKMMRGRMRHPTFGWPLRRGMWVHGVETPVEYLRLTEQYTLEGRARSIACPTLICSAESDEIGATAQKLFDALACEKERMRFYADEGAGEHCESGARSVFNQRAFDWLDRILGAG